MKAKELRIGNLIKGIYHQLDDNHDELELETICEVVTLDITFSGDYSIYVDSDEQIEHFSEFQPIPLTEEWFLKFGLLKTKEGIILMGCYQIVANEESWRIILKNGVLHIQYVHQLQNLYFALTGEELKQQEQ